MKENAIALLERLTNLPATYALCVALGSGLIATTILYVNGMDATAITFLSVTVLCASVGTAKLIVDHSERKQVAQRLAAGQAEHQKRRTALHSRLSSLDTGERRALSPFLGWNRRSMEIADGDEGVASLLSDGLLKPSGDGSTRGKKMYTLGSEAWKYLKANRHLVE